MLNTKEHYELLTMFERQYQHCRLDREPKEGWARGIFYQDGMVNEIFLAFRKGYAFGKAVA